MTTDLKSLRAFLADKPTPPRPNPKRELSEASQEAIKLLKFAGITTLVIIAGLIAMAVVVSFPGASRALYGVAYWFNGINFSSLTSWGFLIGMLGWYFLPAIVASNRQRPDVMSIFIVNLFFGWTVIGWVLALAWAALPVARK